ncbi:MAG: hydroxyacid dehydrogenase [Zetaproteobacteria bacterium CG12_big_fil_rev_8_21_14_0_65_54_13]|nr:MAG: hydroxyacid dehydrogenase [Zetaproteobacteria bacterium CG12_big_fil_rev_8_21_14_0_65_54_13]PIX55057.1 MAG: hydroxyacid dehydrogenase [Zetaproteobacteria bacterium CG_4_10_14_3_um_filter_54_28]
MPNNSKKEPPSNPEDHVSEPAKGQFLVYQAEDGKLKLDVRFEDESVWLTQQLMADLFQTTKQNISLHIQNIYEEGELVPEATVKKYLTVRSEGNRQVKRMLDYYNLDMIISVGYRIKSHVATRFRIWATQKLTEFIKKGFVLDDERLKNPDLPFDYFEELERRIQDIRTSERRFYQKITDIYATSIDYDPTLDISIEFFKTVQNKMHWAITGQTAAEIIHSRADADKPNMGLTNYRGAKVRKQDVTIAKNYLNEDELAALNNLVEQYLIFAQGQAMRRIPMYMGDWIKKLDSFMTLNDREILMHAGKISHEMAKQLAEGEYDKFHTNRLTESSKQISDFDKAVKQIESSKKKGGKQ